MLSYIIFKLIDHNSLPLYHSIILYPKSTVQSFYTGTLRTKNTFSASFNSSILFLTNIIKLLQLLKWKYNSFLNYNFMFVWKNHLILALSFVLLDPQWDVNVSKYSKLKGFTIFIMISAVTVHYHNLNIFIFLLT